jgi:hypothetical protein
MCGKLVTNFRQNKRGKTEVIGKKVNYEIEKWTVTMRSERDPFQTF